MVLLSPDSLRQAFSHAMSDMYRGEVPAYGDLLDIVRDVNDALLASPAKQTLALDAQEDFSRISDERHGAIRLGSAAELAMICRAFRVMGMFPVDYYDLSIASIPVHSTAFRPIERAALAKNPFRVFTSLLRLELIEDEALRHQAEALLAKRAIFSEAAIALIEKAEAQGGLDDADGARFVHEMTATFKWRSHALVSQDTYEALHDAHRLIADVVSFKGPHINHLTPRTLDIDACQRAMGAAGLPAKAVIEGPPRRDCPILLRQTSFKALQESVWFRTQDGQDKAGHHTARFGEIEQRGIALTPKGRALYDQLLAETRAQVKPAPDGSNAADYVAALEASFAAFPDDWRAIYDEELGYFRFSLGSGVDEIDFTRPVADLLDEGALVITPIIYEDFLPVSAAGIFQSNLGDRAAPSYDAAANQQAFEADMGAPIFSGFSLYAAIQDQSLAACREQAAKGAET